MNISFHLANSRGYLDAFALPSVLKDLTRLVRIIRADSHSVTDESLDAFFGGGGVLAFACDGDSIVGVATIAFVPKINGESARVEHVAVLPSHERKGIARKLCGMLISIAGILSLKRLDLSCEPRRIGANLLYESLGFKKRETNSWRLVLA